MCAMSRWLLALFAAVCAAAALAVAPPTPSESMAQVAEHLRSTSVDCKAMQGDLRQLAQSGTVDQANAMSGERLRILQKCVASAINLVDGQQKQKGAPGTVEDYVKRGLLDA